VKSAGKPIARHCKVHTTHQADGSSTNSTSLLPILNTLHGILLLARLSAFDLWAADLNSPAPLAPVTSCPRNCA